MHVLKACIVHTKYNVLFNSLVIIIMPATFCHLCRYPVRVQDSTTDIDDARSVVEHNKAIEEEMKKPKPRDHMLTPLMSSTFQSRRMFIQNEAKTVTEILKNHQALARHAVVSQQSTCTCTPHARFL